MPPAARLTDPHLCPQQTPGTPPVPHTPSPTPIVGPAAATVLIGGLPAAVVGSIAMCAAPTPLDSMDAIVQGSATVLIGGLSAARAGDATAHGGSITVGCPTVLIGG
jgi:uncharacterized Zn-binding protein involved in type VI secretion